MISDITLFTLRYLAFIPLVILAAVISHEAAHLFMARRLGIAAKEIAIGFGPILKSLRTRDGLLISVRAIPAGGFVKLDEASWSAARARDKTLVIGAGVCANFAIASALIFVHTLVWPEYSANETVVVSHAVPGNRLMTGDKVISVRGGTVDMTIDNLPQLEFALTLADGAPVTLDLIRDEERTSVELAPESGRIEGVEFAMRELRRSVIHAALTAAIFNPAMLIMTAHVLYAQIASGEMPEVMGMIGAAKVGGDMMGVSGLSFPILLAAAMNFSIGAMNLLPIPVMDGGRLMFVVIERIRGRPLSERAMGVANALSMALIIALATIILLHDLNDRIF